MVQNEDRELLADGAVIVCNARVLQSKIDGILAHPIVPEERERDNQLGAQVPGES